MATYDLQSHNYGDIVNKVTQRFYPRDLILDEPQIQEAFEEAMQKLDDYSYYPRFYQLPIVGTYVDTNAIVIPGITVKKVTKVHSTQMLESIFTMYSQIIGQTPFYYNIIRNQDTFIEFLLTQQTMNMINQKYRNKDTGWMLMPDGKLLLDPMAYNLDTSVFVAFLPHFQWKVSEAQTWELYSVEFNFLTKYLEGILMFREGRAMGEAKFTGLETNAEEYKADGLEMMEKALQEFKQGGLMKMGKRF